MQLLTTPPAMTYEGHTDRVWSIQVSAGTLISGGGDSIVRIWNVANGACTNFVTANTGAAVVACQRHNNDVYYASSVQAYSYNIQTGALAEESVPTSVAPLALCFDAAPPLIYIGYSDNVIRVWKNGECKGRYKGHTGEIRCLKLSGHAMFTGAEDQQIIRWNTNTAKATVLFKGTAGPIRDLTVNGDELWFANGNNVRCQSIGSGKMLHNLGGHQDVVVCLALYTKRSVVMSGGADNLIVIHSTQTGQPLFSLAPPQATIVKCVKEDAGYLFSAVGNNVYAWDLEPMLAEASGGPAAAVPGPAGRPMAPFPALGGGGGGAGLGGPPGGEGAGFPSMPTVNVPVLGGGFGDSQGGGAPPVGLPGVPAFGAGATGPVSAGDEETYGNLTLLPAGISGFGDTIKGGQGPPPAPPGSGPPPSDGFGGYGPAAAAGYDDAGRISQYDDQGAGGAGAFPSEFPSDFPPPMLAGGGGGGAPPPPPPPPPR